MARVYRYVKSSRFNLFLLSSVVILAASLIVMLSAVKSPQKFISEAAYCEECNFSKPFCSGQYLLKCKSGCEKSTNCGKDGCGTNAEKAPICCNGGGAPPCSVTKSDQCAKVGLQGANYTCYNKNAPNGSGTCGSVFNCCPTGQIWTHADKKCCDPARKYIADSQYQTGDTWCCSHSLTGGKCL